MGLDLLSMLLLGLLGTGHCVGMCGPIVIALPGGGGVAAHLTYHLGRITTYTALGALLAGVGGGLTDVARFQVAVSLLAAIFLLVFGLARLGILSEPRWMQGLSPGRLPGFRRVARSLRGGSRWALLPYGLMMGLLPCGLSYAAFARALAADGPVDGGLLALAFAIGTLPGLMAVGTLAARWVRQHQQLSQILAGVVMVGMAVSIALDAARALPG